jgi:hypothetical protein
MNNRVEKFWGLLTYKPQWTLTLRGWGLVILLAIVLISLVITNIQPFLAVSVPIKADALVVEGWIGDAAVEGAIAEFKRGDYKLLITTGLPISKGSYLVEYHNFAELTAATIIALGFDPNKIIAVPTPDVLRNRTAASALALRQWFASTDMSIKAINLYSSGIHTRRSWLLFKRALAPEISVGAIAHPPTDYNPKYWWTTSEGVKSIICEVIGYVYAKLIN